MSALLHRRLLRALLLALVVCSALALAVENDSIDTVLGALTGMSASLLVGLLVLSRLTRTHQRHVDRDALDRLEPLRAARRDDE